MFLIAYLLGSVPSAVWIGKRYYGVDIREHGSKNAGTTNMLRVLGKRAALPVFAIDFIKGFVAVSIMSLLQYDDNISPIWLINLKIIAVFIAVLGHIFPIFANFKGGKGVATLIGAVTGIQPNIALFVTIFSGSIYRRYGDTSVSFIIFSIVVAVMLIWTHRKNIERLRDGTESKTFIWKPRKHNGKTTEKK